MRSSRSPLLLVTCLGFALLNGRSLFAGGIEVINQDARATGQAEAFAAQADDPGAIYYNPAGLTQLHGTNVSGGGYLLWLNLQKKGPSGDEGMYNPAVLPHLYAETDFGLEKWRFGVGLHNDFGLQLDWGNQGVLRYQVDKARLEVINFSPTIAYEINDHLSIAAEANVYYGDLDLRRNALLGAPPTPDGAFRFRGHDWGAGATAGLMWKLDDKNTIAAIYRSPFSMKFGGPATVYGPGGFQIGPSHSSTVVDFPQMAELAYAFRPIKPWKIETDAVWTNWGETFNNLRLTSGNPAFNGISIPEHWHDSWSLRLGTQYDLDKHWALRGGYAYGTSAVPQHTFNPLVPDAPYHLFSLGLGYAQDNWTLDAAWQYIYRERRNIANNVNSPAVDGTWYNQMYGFMVTFGARF